MRRALRCQFGNYCEVRGDADQRAFAEPVLAETFDNSVRPVLCYIAPQMEDGQATREYVAQLARVVRSAGLPNWYAEFVESFAPQNVKS